MDATKPNSDSYVDWASNNLNHDLDEPRERWYGLATSHLRQLLSEHPFGSGIHDLISDASQEYSSQFNVPLMGLEGQKQFAWHIKPYDSTVEKLFRINVLENENWPDAPDSGWCAPGDIFHRMNDIIRTRLVCDYLDGPEFLAEKFAKLAEDCGLDATYSSRERDRGYYAYHFYVEFPTEIFDISLSREPVEATIEVQITTRLQNVLDVLTHRQYERSRVTEDVISPGWKWEHRTLRFKNAYLAHTLHLLEGIILEVRDHTDA